LARLIRERFPAVNVTCKPFAGVSIDSLTTAAAARLRG
jgi:hypothetical protein